MTRTFNNKRIAKNTLYMYIRMGVTMLVQLYTSRIVLNTLGVDDYGIYNIVGSVIVAFSFISGPLGAATQRFYNFELGRSNEESVNSIFNHSLVIYSLLSVILLLVIEIAGLWFINHRMQLPPERMDAALWAFHFSVLGFVFSLLKVPYESLIVAHERMSFYAYVSIIEVLLKLLNAFSLIYMTVDKLKLYSVNQLVITWVILGCVIAYCKRQFIYVRLQKMWDKKVFRQLLGFSGWSLFGSVSAMSANQGLNVLLNIFYGVAINAAMGIASQVSASVNQFVTNFQIAFRPQLIKLYASDELESLRLLMCQTSKFSYLLLFALVCPLCFNMQFVLEVWLGIPPRYTAEFCIFILIYALFETLSAPMCTVVQATGRIRNYQLVISSVMFFNIIVSYIFLKLGFSPVIVWEIKCCLDLVYLVIRLFFMRRMIQFPIKLFVKDVLLPSVMITICSIIFMTIISNVFEEGWVKLSITCASFFILFVPLIAIIGLTKEERLAVRRITIGKLRHKYGIK